MEVFNKIVATYKNPRLIMMCGLPGSGKSTIAEYYRDKFGYIIHSSDSIREELFGDVNHQDGNEKVFTLLHNRIRQDLLSGKNVIYDATNLSSKRRRGFLKQLDGVECSKYCVLIPTPYEECLKNNLCRERVVPKPVIEKMYKSFQVPYYDEGFNSIFINKKVFDGIAKPVILDILNDLDKIEQDNPHHTLTVGEHCRKTLEYVKNSKYGDERILKNAALLHDFGKSFCKTFINSKGEKTDVAHYYGHENVSSYLAIQFLISFCDEDILKIAYLISHHMRLNQIYSSPNWSTLLRKYRKRIGDEMFEWLYTLREADLVAK